MEFKEEVLKLHKDLKGKVSVENKMEIKTSEELSKVYTPGVSYVCEEIEKNEDNAYIYTMKQNTVAIVTNGIRVSRASITAGLSFLSQPVTFQ